MNIPVYNSLELVIGVDSNQYVRLTQTTEFPHGSITQTVLMTPEEFEDMIATYQERKSAAMAVAKALSETMGGEG